MKHFTAVIIAAALALSARGTTFTFKPDDTDLDDLDHQNAYTWGITATSSGSSYSTLVSQLASGNYYITSATLSIKGLYNWDTADTHNQLFIHLLDNPETGVKTIQDDPLDNGVNEGTLSDYFGGALSTNKVNGKYVAYGYNNTTNVSAIMAGSYFVGTNTYLTQYHDADGPTTKIDYSFGLYNTQLATLASYISNGSKDPGPGTYASWGLGFDGDCHYFNDDISFSITTAPVIHYVPDGGMTATLITSSFLFLAWLRRFTKR